MLIELKLADKKLGGQESDPSVTEPDRSRGRGLQRCGVVVDLEEFNQPWAHSRFKSGGQ